MPRIADTRSAAEPSSPKQRARYREILHSAAELAADRGFDRVQMHDVAKDAGVAIATLYRYFPSKTHLFTAVMADEVERLSENLPAPRSDQSPPEAVHELLTRASRHMLQRPRLANAMLQSMNSAHAATITDVGRIDRMFREVIFRTLGIDEPTEHDATLARLVLQCWYGVLTASVNGRVSLPDAESDIGTACRLLLESRSNA